MSWADPEVETVAPGVHRAPVPMPFDGLKAINVYVIEDGDGITLVDAGWDGPAAMAAVDAGLAAAGAGIGDVRRMLITHVHYDHLGQATSLRRAGAGEYWLGEQERVTFDNLVNDPVASFQRRMDILEQYGAVELAEGGRRRGGMASRPLDLDPPDRWASDGDRAPLADGELVAVHTPGHTRGHLCFHQPGRRLLFAGDHVLPHITPSLGIESETNSEALGMFLESLVRVTKLEVDLVLPAHGPAFADLQGRVDELLAHHDDRLDACVEAISADGSTAFTVATRLPWTRRHTDFADLDGLNQVFAVWETIAHLELLATRGVLERVEQEGTVVFRRRPRPADPTG